MRLPQTSLIDSANSFEYLLDSNHSNTWMAICLWIRTWGSLGDSRDRCSAGLSPEVSVCQLWCKCVVRRKWSAGKGDTLYYGVLRWYSWQKVVRHSHMYICAQQSHLAPVSTHLWTLSATNTSLPGPVNHPLQVLQVARQTVLKSAVGRLRSMQSRLWWGPRRDHIT